MRKTAIRAIAIVLVACITCDPFLAPLGGAALVSPRTHSMAHVVVPFAAEALSAPATLFHPPSLRVLTPIIEELNQEIGSTPHASEPADHRLPRTILPLRRYVQDAELSKNTVAGEINVTALIDKARQGIKAAGYQDNDILTRAYTVKSLYTDECLVFHTKRLRIVLFKARPEMPAVTGYRANDLKYEKGKAEYDAAYLYSIENERTEMVGHGILTHYASEPHRSYFRYSIHGQKGVAHTHDFQKFGYGIEALALFIMMSARGDIFPQPIDEVCYLTLREDFALFSGAKKEAQIKMENFLVSAGFIDESRQEGKVALIFPVRAPQPFDENTLARIVAERLSLRRQEDGISNVRALLMRRAECAFLPVFAKALAARAGMTVPKDFDWKEFGVRVWDSLPLPSPEDYRENVQKCLTAQEKVLARVERCSVWKAQIPGTMLARAVSRAVVSGADWIEIHHRMGSIDEIRSYPSHDKAFLDREGSGHKVQLFFSDPLLPDHLRRFVEPPARKTVMTIVEQGGLVGRTNANGEGEWGVWWSKDGEDYFTPLTLNDYLEAGTTREPLYAPDSSLLNETDSTPTSNNSGHLPGSPNPLPTSRPTAAAA